ncbi:MAG: tRNA (N(6)-L-threonylcarbamoyladenosine(37)-C(2))-methylthiotransferase [Methanothrix sp.]|nr:tRNA (N(6)-L-threonylcarbamoyladenosine(37)-C(2))-methylthiotransferase [Methanothrix sp.]
MKFYIETFGCTANQGYSQDLARALQETGHTETTLDEADAVIVNTCAVTEKTERKVLRRLSQLQGDRLIVAGCLSVAVPESLNGIRCRARYGLLNQSSASGISALFGVTQNGSPARLPEGIGSRTMPSGLGQSDSLCAVVNVSEGCNGSCSYCIVSIARGRLKSRSVEDVAAEVAGLAAMGAAEVQISAQDTASYGSDIGTDLGRLLDRMAVIPGDFRLRVGMMNPNNVLLIKDRLLRAYQSPRIYRFLHIPVQSGSDEILRSMGRRYSAEDFLNIAGAFRSSFPKITIITDVIVGFPGETEEDFLETLQLIERLDPDKVNITRFSARPGTAAASKYDMPDRIKKDRSRELTRLWLDIAARRNMQYKGQILEARITERGRDGTMKARAENYLGIVIKCQLRLGSLIRVLVEESNAFYVSGRIVED